MVNYFPILILCSTRSLQCSRQHQNQRIYVYIHASLHGMFAFRTSYQFYTFRIILTTLFSCKNSWVSKYLRIQDWWCYSLSSKYPWVNAYLSQPRDLSSWLLAYSDWRSYTLWCVTLRFVHRHNSGVNKRVNTSYEQIQRMWNIENHPAARTFLLLRICSHFWHNELTMMCPDSEKLISTWLESEVQKRLALTRSVHCNIEFLYRWN